MNYTNMSPETAQAFEYFAELEAQEEATELLNTITPVLNTFNKIVNGFKLYNTSSDLSFFNTNNLINFEVKKIASTTNINFLNDYKSNLIDVEVLNNYMIEKEKQSISSNTQAAKTNNKKSKSL